MSELQTPDRDHLRLASALLVKGLVFIMLPILAQSAEAPCPTELSADIATRGGAGQEIVRAADIMKALGQEGGELDYSGRIIEGDLNLFDLCPEAGPDGKEAIIIKRPLTFRKTIFKGRISTWNSSDKTKRFQEWPPVRFLSRVNFIEARFEDHVSLDAAVFQEDTDFGAAHFHKMASFNAAKFESFAGFFSAQFDERALFRSTDFRGDAHFGLAIFNWLAFFLEAKFLVPRNGVPETEQPGKPKADFLYTRFKGDTIFSKSTFESAAHFVGTNFHGPTHFSATTFKDQALFVGGTQFDDNVTFKEAQFLKEDTIKVSRRLKEGGEIQVERAPVLFSGVVFSGDAIFAEATFHQVAFAEVGYADIGRSTSFRGRVDFKEALFDTLDLRRVIFQSEVDFSGAALGKKIDLTNVSSERASFRIEWAQLLRPDERPTWVQLLCPDERPKVEWQGAFANGQLKQSSKKEDAQRRRDFFNFLSLLERNLEQREQLSDARGVHYFTQELKRLESSGLPYLWDTLVVKGIYGYGVKVSHQLCVALILIVGFAFVYAQRGVLKYDPTKKNKLLLEVELPIADWSSEEESPQAETVAPAPEPGQPEGFLQRYWRGLNLSLAIFVKLKKPGGVYAVRKYVKYVAGLEWTLSKGLWILMLINLSNTWPLLHRLITMLG